MLVIIGFAENPMITMLLISKKFAIGSFQVHMDSSKFQAKSGEYKKDYLEKKMIFIEPHRLRLFPTSLILSLLVIIPRIAIAIGTIAV